MDESETKRIRRTPEQIAAGIDEQIANLESSEPVFTSVQHRLDGAFPATLRCFSLKYTKYSCVKAP